MKKPIFLAIILFLLCAAGSYTIAATRQPDLKTALEHLNLASKELQAVNPKDKGNHCVQAIQLIKDAIEEVKKAMSYRTKN
jgi:hypothetical protein